MIITTAITFEKRHDFEIDVIGVLRILVPTGANNSPFWLRTL